MHEKIITSLEEMDAFAKEVLDSLKRENEATILSLHGDLGAGKTAFTKALAKAFSIKDVITSPTFVLMKNYSVTHPEYTSLIHIDAYRIEDPHELEVVGWHVISKDPTNIIVLEWPEKIGSLLPGTAHTYNFTFIDDTTRKITW